MAEYRKRLAAAGSIKPNVIQQHEWEKRPDCPACQDTLGGTLDADGVCDGCGHHAFA